MLNCVISPGRNSSCRATTNRRQGAASALAVTVALCGLGAAGATQAQSIPNTNLSPGLTYLVPGPAEPGAPATLTAPASVTVTTGENAFVAPFWAGLPGAVLSNSVVLGYYGPYDGATLTGVVTPSATNGGSALGYQIIVQPGATLTFADLQSLGAGVGGIWVVTFDMVNSSGNVNFEGNSQHFSLDGNNTILGNVNVEAQSNVRFGESYGAGELTLGPTTNMTLGANSTVLLNDVPGFTTTMGGMLAAVPTAYFELAGGTLVVNGQNTAANPFVGTLQVDPGATFVVGDSTHKSAVFGDPGNTNGSTETLTVGRSGGTPATLQGYGTIYAIVNNSGVVQPGGTAGAPGTLTVSQYNQTSTGILQIEVTPNGASQLKVLGAATLDGTLQLTIDPGHYGNAVMPVLSAGSLTLAKTFQVETIGNEGAGLAITATGIDVVTELTSSAQVFGHLVASDRSNLSSFNDTVYDIQVSDGANGAGPASKATYGNGFDAWIEPFGRTARVSHQGLGYNTTSEGFTAGFEHKWDNNAVAGVSVSYASENLKTDGGMTNSTSDAVDLGFYGGYRFENYRVEGVVFYNSYSANVTRNLGSSGVIGSSPTGQAAGVSVQVSNTLYSNLLEPYIRMTYSDIRQERVAETGANLLALDVHALETGFFDGEVGVKIHPSFLKFAAGLHPEITLAAQHDFTQYPGEQVVAQFANLSGAPFTYSWKGDQGTAAIAGLMLSSNVGSRFNVFGKIGGRFTTDASSGEVRVGASYRF